MNLRKADPEIKLELNQYTDYRAVTFDPDWRFTATCGNCANICWKDREKREKNMRLIVDSGVVVLNADGTRAATREEIVELETPYGMRVAVSKPEYEKMLSSKVNAPAVKGYLPRDRDVLTHLLRNGAATKMAKMAKIHP